METTKAENSTAKSSTENKPKNAPIVNNGEGVKAAYEKAIKNLPEKFEKLWSNEGGKKFLTHMIFSFLPLNKKEVFPIGKFEEHNKYKEVPKVCTLTGFAVSDSGFSMDEVTKKYYSEKRMKVNKLVFAIPCVGSTESTKIVSNEALQGLRDWVKGKCEAELNTKEKDFNRIMSSVLNKMKDKEFKNKKKPVSEEDKNSSNVSYSNKDIKPATHTLGDKYDWDALKSKFTEK